MSVLLSRYLSSYSHCPLGIVEGETKPGYILLFPRHVRMLTADAGDGLVSKISQEHRRFFTLHKYQGDHDRCRAGRLQGILISEGAGQRSPCFQPVISVNLVFHQGQQSVKTLASRPWKV